MRTSFLSLAFMFVAVLCVTAFSFYSLDILGLQKNNNTELRTNKVDVLPDTPNNPENMIHLEEPVVKMVDMKEDVIVQKKVEKQAQKETATKEQITEPVCAGILCNGECWKKCPVNHDFVCEPKKSAQCVAKEGAEAPLPDYFAEPNDIEEENIDIETVVLIKCDFRSQYFDESQTPWNEQRVTIGSGVLVSPGGHILTAGHVIKPSESWSNDQAGREWELLECKVAQTDRQQTPIPAIKYWGQPDDERFESVEIIFEVPGEEYKEASGLDFAILKTDADMKSSFVNIFSKIIDFAEKDQLIAIGYPSKISTVPQTLERFDGSFAQFAYLFGADCNQLEKACGLRYESQRSSFDYRDEFWKETELGIVTPWGRGGFSGGPVFYKGNLIGIMTHADLEGNESGLGGQWEKTYTLTSYDIIQALSKYNIKF